MDDPFAHHPGLRGRIADPEQNFLRNVDLPTFARELEAKGLSTDWWTPEAEREAGRRAFLDGHAGDLWVFGYGSLMWDPGFHFAEVRRAFLPGFARRFILKDTRGGRGTPERPGLMVALDPDPDGPGCHGLALRIAAADVERESYFLWKRERIGSAYNEAWVTAESDHGSLRAMTFVADHDSDLIDAGLTFDQQVTCCATGAGFLGSSLDYIRSIASHFAELRIEDPDVARLLAAAEAAARS